MTTRAVARLWLSHQKSFASVASNQSVNDALQKGYRQQQVGNSPCISEESTVQEAARRFMSDGVGSLIAMNSIGTYLVRIAFVACTVLKHSAYYSLFLKDELVASLVSETLFEKLLCSTEILQKLKSRTFTRLHPI